MTNAYKISQKFLEKYLDGMYSGNRDSMQVIDAVICELFDSMINAGLDDEVIDAIERAENN